jgi:elongation factor P
VALHFLVFAIEKACLIFDDLFSFLKSSTLLQLRFVQQIMATTSDLAKGVIVRFNGELHVCEEVVHRTPGNLRAFYQVKMRNLRHGRIVENRFRSGEEVEVVETERKTFQYLYRDGDDFVLMDNQTYDQTHVPSSAFGEQAKFLKESMTVEVVYASDGSIVQAEAPTFVELTVIDTSPSTKDERATASTKPATLETGAVVQVPMFVLTGDVVRVDTRTGEYIDRVSKK